MAHEAKGTSFESRGRHFAQISLGGGRRKAVLVPHAPEGPAGKSAALERAGFIAELVGQVRQAGKAGLIDLEKLAREAAAATTESELADLRTIVNELTGGASLPTSKHATRLGSTFKMIGQQWTSGELARMYKDHIRTKRTAKDDGYRLELLYAAIGDIPVTADNWIDHAERAMRKLPETLSPASRRHYAQLISRVLGMACYPLRLIKASPLPRGWLPKLGPKKGKFYLYPIEDAQLLACRSVPLVRRMLEGFLDREGMRSSEAAQLQWTDISSAGEVTLDENKTDDPRAWALARNVFVALKLWHTLQKAEGPTEYVFAWKGQRVDVEHLADQLRNDLESAGVERAALFKKKSAKRLRLRAHDLRGTFVTIWLANDKTETWVMDRTGHTTSGMLNAYRQAARSAKELGLGTLKPLDQAIPELAQLQAAERSTASKRNLPKGEGAEKAPDHNEVHEERLELSRCYPPEPKSGASAIPPLVLEIRAIFPLFDHLGDRLIGHAAYPRAPAPQHFEAASHAVDTDVTSAAMRLALRASFAILLAMFALGCDAVKPREPKQVQDPPIRSSKYGNMQVNIEPDAGSAEPSK